MSRAAPRSDRSDAAEAILDAAEMVFAENGFHGATTRAIAEAAGANAALIHYYFGSKEALFEAVIARRAGAINDERRARLTTLHAHGQPSLEDVLDALLRPTVELGRDPARGGAHYVRLLAHAAASTDERSKRLTGRHYDDIARVFIAEFAAAAPGLSHTDAVQMYLTTIGIGIALMAPTGRASDLGAGDDDDLDTLIGRSVRFIAAGIRSLTTPPEPTHQREEKP